MIINANETITGINTVFIMLAVFLMIFMLIIFPSNLSKRGGRRK